MGILTDFVIADAGDGPKIADSANADEIWPTLEAKGVNIVELATLYCAVAEKPYHSDIATSFKQVGSNGDEGPWVFEFPPQVLHSIASIDEGRVPELAKAWGSTEELRMLRWSVQDAAEFIAELASHAAEAVATGKSMYLWLSL